MKPIDHQMEVLLQLIVFIIHLLFSTPRVESISILSHEKNMGYGSQFDSLSKISIKTIQDKHGEVFHCINMYEQPAFDHPLLINHTIQMGPAFSEEIANEFPKSRNLFKIGLNTTCPNGTVLIKHHPQGDSQIGSSIISVPKAPYINPHEAHFASVLIRSGISWKYYGAQSTMDVFNISQISNTQTSAIVLVILNGLDGPLNYTNFIAFGWRVVPGLYGDKKSRFYIEWTSDGWQKTGCHNLDCPGFIQLSKSFTPGMILPTGKGVLKLGAYRDAKTLNWYLRTLGGELIGYWPKEIFNNLVNGSEVQVNGFVYSPLNERSPPMGNGVFPKPDPSKACEVSHIRSVNENGDLIVPGSDIISYDLQNPGFYDVTIEPKVDDFVVSVGGPGGQIK